MNTLAHTQTNGMSPVCVCVCVHAQMRELVSSLSSDKSARVVIFRSLVPGVFCAGKCSCKTSPPLIYFFSCSILFFDVNVMQVQTWKREPRWATPSRTCSFTACDPSWLRLVIGLVDNFWFCHFQTDVRAYKSYYYLCTQLCCPCRPSLRWTAWPWVGVWSWPWPVTSAQLVSRPLNQLSLSSVFFSFVPVDDVNHA